MGRKKRKVVVAGAESLGTAGTGIDVGRSHFDGIPPPPPPADPRMSGNNRIQQQNVLLAAKNTGGPDKSSDNTSITNSTKKMSSGYATTSHSAEIIDEDIYVSDGSESDEDLMADLQIISQQNASSDGSVDDSEITTKTNIAGRSIEMVLSGSKMGLMRRGIHRPQVLVQPNRQWARQPKAEQDSKNDKIRSNGDVSGDGADDTNDSATAEERRKREQEEELAKLDPAQRAARLLAEKQRKLEEAKILARKLESEENAGRDPCLFSKRTSFDIRFDQIDDKPWLRGAGDTTDFFNYGFSEEDWLEYGEQQLMIRQELIDANRQKRAPDPSIVPVIPKKPKKQNPRVAVTTGNTEATEEDTPNDEMDVDGTMGGDGSKDDQGDGSSQMAIGPLRKKEGVKDEKTENNSTSTTATIMQGPANNEASSSSNDLPDVEIGVGGAWGMGAAPGSVLAKLIEEQDKQQQQQQNNTQKQIEIKISHHHQETTHNPSQPADLSPRKGAENYSAGNKKYENNPVPSYYGGGDSSGGYKDKQPPDQQNDHHYGWNKHNSQQGDENRHDSAEGNRNYRRQNHGGDSDRNNSGGSQKNSDWNNRNNDRGSAHYHHQQQHQGWNDGGHGGYRASSRGGSGHRNGGDYGGGKGRGRGSSYGDRSDYQRRKRPREDYNDRNKR